MSGLDAAKIYLGADEVAKVYFAGEEVYGQTPPVIPQTLFGQRIPASKISDPLDVELGTVFTLAKPGKITGLRFYRSDIQTSNSFTMSLWDAAVTDTPLVQIEIDGASDVGWQRGELPSPLSVVADKRYIVSYLCVGGNYAYEAHLFDQDFVSGDITAPATSQNGRFTYTSTPVFPTDYYNNTSYFADIEFVAD